MQETRSYLQIILESFPLLAIAHNLFLLLSTMDEKTNRLVSSSFVLFSYVSHKIYTSCLLILSRKYVLDDNSIRRIKPIPIEAPCEVL